MLRCFIHIEHISALTCVKFAVLHLSRSVIMNLPLPLCVGEAILSKVFSLIATWKTRTMLRAEVYSFCRALQRRWQACRHVCFHEEMLPVLKFAIFCRSCGWVGTSISLRPNLTSCYSTRVRAGGKKTHTAPRELCRHLSPAW